MERANLSMTKKGPGFNNLPVVGKSKPIKPVAQTSNVFKSKINQSDKEQLSRLMSEMSEESKRQEARNFDNSKQKNLKMMQELTKQLEKSNRDIPREEDEDCDGDELEDYMEQSLMAEANDLGMLSVNEGDVYSDALKRVEGAMQTQQMQIDTWSSRPQNEMDEMDQYADDLMNEMESEFIH